MQPAEALADLKELSTEVEAAVMTDAGGAVLASTLPDDRSREVARIARSLLGTADEVRGRDDIAVTQLELALRSGSVFVVTDGKRTIVATTGPDPTTGLVLYDLRAALRGLDEDAGGA